MLAVHAMSGGTQAVIYFIALVLFIIAAVIAYIPQPRSYATIWPTFVAIGLALWTLVAFWNALALS